MQIFSIFIPTVNFFNGISGIHRSMAQHTSAEKQARKALKNRASNRRYSSMLKTAVKRVRLAKDKDKAKSELLRTTKLLDQLAARGLIHRNKAANQKSKLTKLVNAIK